MTPSEKDNSAAANSEIKRRGRHRLIGAITLGLLAAVFLPMVFDAEPKRDQQNNPALVVKIPAKEGIAPLPAPGSPPQSTPVIEPTKVDTTETVNRNEFATPHAPVVEAPKANEAKPAPPASESAKPAAKSAEKSDSRREPAAATQPPPVVTKAAGASPTKAGFVVQLGAFKDADNAKQVLAQAAKLGMKASTDSVPTKAGPVTRVRAGPYNRREEAEAALAKAAREGLSGKIVPLP